MPWFHLSKGRIVKVTASVEGIATREIIEHAKKCLARRGGQHEEAGTITPDPALKGRRGGNCNRTHCQRPGATWFNKTMNAYYCWRCAELINESPTYDGKPLCVRCPELGEPE